MENVVLLPHLGSADGRNAQRDGDEGGGQHHRLLRGARAAGPGGLVAYRCAPTVLRSPEGPRGLASRPKSRRARPGMKSTAMAKRLDSTKVAAAMMKLGTAGRPSGSIIERADDHGLVDNVKREDEPVDRDQPRIRLVEMTGGEADQGQGHRPGKQEDRGEEQGFIGVAADCPLGQVSQAKA